VALVGDRAVPLPVFHRRRNRRRVRRHQLRHRRADPARVRGRVDLVINGSFWLGTAGGAVLSVVLLNESFFAADLGWRLAFGLGAVFGLAILLVRRNVPESPRWMFIHGKEDQAEEVVQDIEGRVEDSTDEQLEEVTRVRSEKRLPLGPCPALMRSHCSAGTSASSPSAGTWPGPRSVQVHGGSVRLTARTSATARSSGQIRCRRSPPWTVSPVTHPAAPQPSRRARAEPGELGLGAEGDLVGHTGLGAAARSLASYPD
jgi:Sugar (and other) transporter